MGVGYVGAPPAAAVGARREVVARAAVDDRDEPVPIFFFLFLRQKTHNHDSWRELLCNLLDVKV
jgi:hypothetical protein